MGRKVGGGRCEEEDVRKCMRSVREGGLKVCGRWKNV